jgi:hypothetical protein
MTQSIKIVASCFGVVLLSLSLVFLYVVEVQPYVAYLGYQPLDFSVEYVFKVALVLGVVFLLMPTEIRKPSDYFCLSFCVIVILPFGLLHTSIGAVPLDRFFWGLTTVALPVALVKTAANFKIAVDVPGFLRASVLENIMYLLMLLGTIYILIMAPTAAGLDIASTYVRRLEGREIFTARSIGGYALGITANGLLPLVAFNAGIDQKKIRFLVVLLCSLVFFYAVGLKAQFPIVVASYILGRKISRKTDALVPQQLIGIMILIVLIPIIEHFFLSFSFTADLIIRRIFVSPAYVISEYFDLMGKPGGGWSPISGVVAPEGVTYLIGQQYHNNPNSNVNTNTFVHQLASGGVIAYCGTMLLVLLMLFFLDTLHRKKNQAVYVYLGFIFSILLIEQNVLTTLLSSGVGLLIISFSIIKKRYAPPPDGVARKADALTLGGLP